MGLFGNKFPLVVFCFPICTFSNDNGNVTVDSQGLNEYIIVCVQCKNALI